MTAITTLAGIDDNVSLLETGNDKKIFFSWLQPVNCRNVKSIIDRICKNFLSLIRAEKVCLN